MSTPHPDDTIVALSSAPGPGRRAVVRVTGPRAAEVVVAVFSPAEALPRKSLTPGAVRLTGVPAPLPADLYFWPAPRTYTGQHLAELHTVSSPPLVERLKETLVLHPGDTEVHVKLLNGGKVTTLRLGPFRVAATTALMGDLKSVLGPANVS